MNNRYKVWQGWIGFGILWELLGAMRKKPKDLLTEYTRDKIITNWFGSAVMGAFLSWLVYHWLFDTKTVDTKDAAAAAVGAGVGYAGYRARKKAKEQEAQ